jgi:hypothetical protein
MDISPCSHGIELAKKLTTSSSSTMLTIFGGSVSDLTPMLTEERFSENWEPRVLSRYGLTFAKFNGTVLPVERGVDKKKIEQEEAQKQAVEVSETPTPAAT